MAGSLRWLGGESADRAGLSVDVGQADADRAAELLVGAPTGFKYDEWSHAGAYLFADLPEAEPGVLDAVADVAFDGGHIDGDSFGVYVALAGDLTGDGAPDVAIMGGVDNYLDICVYELTVVEGRHVPADAYSICTQEVDEDGLWKVWACGDVDHDGADDLCATMERETDPSGDWGLAVFRGPLAGPLVLSSASIRLVGPAAETPADFVVGQTDVTGDGLTDLLISSPYFEGGRGSVALVDEVPHGDVELAAFPSWTGDEPDALLGESAAAGGDLDGDGLVDVFLGAAVSHDRVGRGYVATDKDGGPVAESHAVFAGSHPLDWMGASAAFGDFDDDGSDDVAIGVPTDIYFDGRRPGRVAVYRGPLAAGTRTDEDADLILQASDEPDGFGLRMDAGDLDADDIADLVVAAPVDDLIAPDAGAVYLIPCAGLCDRP